MAQTVGDFFWQRLHDWGVRTVFGYPGDGINGLLGALRRFDDKIELIQVRHEEMAAFMASGYAKFTGKLGVCLATSGPGVSHLITGMYDARLGSYAAARRGWAAGADRGRRALPAGDRSAQHVQGRRWRLRGPIGAGTPEPGPMGEHKH